MRASSINLLAGLVLCVILPAAAPSWLAAEEPKTEAQEALVARIEKQLDSIQNRMLELQEQELNLTMKIMQAQQKATEALKNPGKVAEQLAKGAQTKELREYKAILLSGARRLQAFDGRLLPLLKSMKALQRDREKAPDALKVRIDSLATRIQVKHRTNLDKIANRYEQAAEWGLALQVYSMIYSEIPEKDRAKDTTLTERLANLYDKAGDPRKSLLYYKSLFEAKDLKVRYRDKKLGEKVAGLYAKCGDWRSALNLYWALLQAIPPDKQEKDGKSLRDRIQEIEKKTGRPSRPSQPSKSTDKKHWK